MARKSFQIILKILFFNDFAITATDFWWLKKNRCKGIELHVDPSFENNRFRLSHK